MTDQYDTASWLADFSVPEAPTGAVLTITFGAAGVWIGRVDGHRHIVAAQSERRIVPEALDLRIACELLENDSVPEAEDPEVFDELTGLAERARTSIGTRESTLVMGTGTLRFVSVSLTEMVEATVPEVNRVHGMVVELAGSDPVDAILLGPGTEQWPGLARALDERGFTVLNPGAQFPDTFGGDDEDPTETLDRVVSAPAALAWGAETIDDGPVSFSASGIDPADYGLDEYGNVLYENVDGADPVRDDLAPVSDEDADEEQRAAERRRRWRMTAAAAFVVLLGLGGVGTAVAMNVHEHSGPSMDQLSDVSGTTSKSEDESVAPEHIPNSADRAEVSAARAEMLDYTTPPPPPKPKTTTSAPKPRQTEERPAPGPTPTPKPRKRTIPNPIPGLPPIVVG